MILDSNKLENSSKPIFLSISIKVNSTGAYIIDKLWAQYLNYNSELLTELGIDNNPLSMDRITADQSNANNVLINNINRGRIYEMRAFFDEVLKLFGHRVEIESTSASSTSIHDDVKDNVEEQ